VGARAAAGVALPPWRPVARWVPAAAAPRPTPRHGPAPRRPPRGKLLDDTEGALVDSTANAKSVHAKAKERYAAGKRGFCWTCMMLLIVAGVFAGMMVYIKLTAMVGITGRRAPPPRGRGRGL
jgi:hypothetical protein